jgi:nucleotide-binding universal stress UspA family protein
MKNILLPTDFSENSWNAIEYALSFYKESICNFHLLHVNRLNNIITHDTPYIPSQEVIEEVFIKPSKQQLEKLLKRIVNEIPTNKKHHFLTLIDYNLFINSIRKHVKEKKIDLIVMGTKGASGLQEFMIGSNTGDVITKVPCTTLIVPENAKYTMLKEIALPTDFVLSYNVQILQSISEILKETNSSLNIVHISKKGGALNLDQQNNKNLLEDLFDEYNYSFHILTNTKVENALEYFVESRDIDMIVMVAKNLNYFQQILFHSKVEKISYHTKVPFLVLHE